MSVIALDRPKTMVLRLQKRTNDTLLFFRPSSSWCRTNNFYYLLYGLLQQRYKICGMYGKKVYFVIWAINNGDKRLLYPEKTPIFVSRIMLNNRK